MALGPKAMGEAIIANLKAKTGKDLAGWEAELRASGLSDPTEARQHLMELGLGRFQAVTVVEHAFGLHAYADDHHLVDDQFARYPDLRPLYDRAVAGLDADTFTPKPCRGYLPIYRDGRTVLSFTATKSGLYAALTLRTPEAWPDSVDHKPSLGGSARLKHGVYLRDEAELDRLLDEVR